MRFSYLELRLQRQEVSIGFQIGISLADRQEAPQRAAKLRLRILELLHLVGIGDGGGVDLDLRRLGARLGDLREDILFLLGVTLHRGDQIGNKIGAALILSLYLRPFGLGVFLERWNSIIADPATLNPSETTTASWRQREMRLI